ncbi:MAG TPA: CAP domain-containing protein [Thermoanaerobaculia bacterium]
MRRAALPIASTFVFALSILPAQGQGDARSELLRQINDERARAGAPLLQLDGRLNQAAQRHAEEIARRGALRDVGEGTEEELKRAGYNAHAWGVNTTVTTQSLAGLLRHWRTENSGSWWKLMDAEYRDLGIGVSRLRDTPLYVFFYAVPKEDHFARATVGLRDPDQVRARMLAAVNAVRKRAGLRLLKADPELDRAAQAHAEDMLRRSYFDHESPSGTTVRERSRSAGYDWRTIGENIAEGQLSVDEVMDTWMRSPGHRKNILNPDFRELGLGLAAGRSPKGEYRVTWVQNFGTPR